MSIFNNESILAWLKYFSDNTAIDLASIRILDVTGSDKNLMAAVQANPSVLVFTDGTHPEIFYNRWVYTEGNHPYIFYNRWETGLGDCLVW